MMVPGFKPVGWIAAVAGSAIGCYMLSLNVASERAELLRIEQEIIATKQDIRSLQTELGTRGRLAQLEQWNAEVLALSAPTTPQFLENEVKLARFDQVAPTLEERAEVRMASADVAAAPAKKIEAPVLKAVAPEADAPARNPLLLQASLAVPAPRVQKSSALTPVPAKPAVPVAVLAKPARATGTPQPVRTANADTGARVPAKVMQEVRSATRLDSGLARQIAAAARLEAGRGVR